MKISDLENLPETPGQSTRITRRTFIKRTSSTVIATCLALHAFRYEAYAADAGSSFIFLYPVEFIQESVTPAGGALTAHSIHKETDDGINYHKLRIAVSEPTKTPKNPGPTKPGDDGPFYQGEWDVNLTVTTQHLVSANDIDFWPLETITETVTLNLKNEGDGNKIGPFAAGVLKASGQGNSDCKGTLSLGIQIVAGFDDNKHGLKFTIHVVGSLGGGNATNTGYFEINDHDDPPAVMEFENDSWEGQEHGVDGTIEFREGIKEMYQDEYKAWFDKYWTA
jgi:hypothetical protein